MLRLILGTIGVIMGFFGLITNLYILLILVLHKKTRSSSEWILLHLSSCGIGASLCNVLFSSPSILWDNWWASTFVFCDFIGAFVLIIQFLSVWSICALSADRCAAIVSPLRYTQVVTRKRVGAYFFTVWTLSFITVILAFSFSAAHRLPPDSYATIESLQHSLDPNQGQNPSTFDDQNYDNENVIPTLPTPLTFPHTSYHSESIQNRVNLIEAMDLTFRVSSDQNGGRSLGIPWEDLESEEGRTVLISGDYSHSEPTIPYETDEPFAFVFRPTLGLCLPKINDYTWQSLAWTTVWIILVLIAPLATLLICDLIVLSIARRQRHRIVMALYQITLSAQATVTRSKGTAPPSLWMNRTVPAKSRACRAVWEDMGSLFILNCPMLLITILDTLSREYAYLPVEFLYPLSSITLFCLPLYNALLYGVRARPIRATVRSYMRKRMTNSTLQQEIQQRLSPVDGSPRPSSRAKSFRSSSPSPNSSPSENHHRRLSTNDLRPPSQNHCFLTNSPSHGHLGQGRGYHDNHLTLKTRKVRSFLHIPTQYDVHEFWSGLRKPQRSPTIVITHEIRLKDSVNSLVSSSSSPLTNAEHML